MRESFLDSNLGIALGAFVSAPIIAGMAYVFFYGFLGGSTTETVVGAIVFWLLNLAHTLYNRAARRSGWPQERIVLGLVTYGVLIGLEILAIGIHSRAFTSQFAGIFVVGILVSAVIGFLAATRRLT